MTSSVIVQPLEPVLPMDDIQGIAVPGFLKQHQTLIGFQIPEGSQPVRNFKSLLCSPQLRIANANETLLDRRRHEDLREATKQRYPKDAPRVVLRAVGFTYPGLLKLTPGAEAIPSPAFKAGLAARSKLLGDPTSGDGSVGKWIVGAPGQELDGIFVVAGDERSDVDQVAKELRALLAKAAANVIYVENGDIRPDKPGHEHFGFDDGISQPGIRGRASEKSHDYITKRRLATSSGTAAVLFGYPGQDLVWPGTLLLGQPTTSPDPLIPGIPSPAVPTWTQNGSFLVFRRLEQDVGLFWRTMRDLASDLSGKPGFAGITDEALAARLVGRWPSGAPVNRVPNTDDPDLGEEPLANNHFRFDSPAAPLPLVSGYKDNFPMSQPDPAGSTCPWAAHIRKVNTRDSGSDTGGKESTYRRRLLRVGVPFGEPLEDRYADKTADKNFRKRGLLFLSIQSSIDEQFEFLMARWMGDPSRPKMPGGHDILVGQNDMPGEDRTRRCVIFGANLQQAEIKTAAQWIIPTGGGYFFVPSLSALVDVLAGPTPTP